MAKGCFFSFLVGFLKVPCLGFKESFIFFLPFFRRLFVHRTPFFVYYVRGDAKEEEEEEEEEEPAAFVPTKTTARENRRRRERERHRRVVFL